MYTLFSPLLMIVMLGLLSGCNTIHGIGNDLASLGGGMADTADASRAQLRDWTEEAPAEDAAPHAHEGAAVAEPYPAHRNSASLSFNSR